MEIIGRDGTKYKDYNAYLMSDEWQEVRAQRLETDHQRCVCCGSKENLRVHHINYKHMHEMDFLVTLCDACHKKVHKEVLPMLAQEVEALNNAYSSKFESIMKEYQQERGEVVTRWLNKLGKNGKLADKMRSVRIITKADMKGLQSAELYFEPLTTKIMSMLGCGKEKDTHKVIWR